MFAYFLRSVFHFLRAYLNQQVHLQLAVVEVRLYALDQYKILCLLLHPKNWRAGFPWNTSENSKHFYEILKY